MPSANFTNLPRALAKGDIDFDTLTTKVMLVTSALSESNLDTWVNRSDVTNEVANGDGYATGGIAQAFTLNALDTTNNLQSVAYTDITNGWTGATFSAAGAIIYKNTGSAATDTLMHYVEFAAALAPVNGNASIDYISTFNIAR